MHQNADLYALLETCPGNSPYWSLADAFDAATNGMENPEGFARMETIQDPRFRSWQALIRAIKALYAGDLAACRSAADAIPENEAPGALKPLFRAWIHRHDPKNREGIFEELSRSCDAVAELYRRLLVEPHPLSLMAEQAEEALRHDLPEQFKTLAVRIMKKLREERRCDGPLLALRYARYCIDLLNRAGYGGSDFFSAIIGVLGEADGFCALGFALIGRDNEAAARVLRKALKAGDGLFLEGETRALAAGIAAQLESSPLPASGPRPEAGRPRGGRRKKARNPEQPELFGDMYG
ncbi:MAG: hypothetical protein LBQ38_04225 [Spirochaetaceae bacterium]|jgi:hypothetical protein|nr:hypothetical protein [Spirochaetaceae bacterium]